MFNQSTMIHGIESTHEFVCFRLKFVDPHGDHDLGVSAHQNVPLSALHMVQRGTGLRHALYFRIENVTYDRMKHDDQVVRAVLKSFIKDLFDQQLADHMPTTSPHSNVDPQADDESLDKIYAMLTQGIWNAIHMQQYNDPIAYNAGGINTSRLNVSFGNGLGFIMTLNKDDLYRAANCRLSGTVPFSGKRHHFAFFHSELSSEDLESMLNPHQCAYLLRAHLNEYAPIFSGLVSVMEFAD